MSKATKSPAPFDFQNASVDKIIQELIEREMWDGPPPIRQTKPDDTRVERAYRQPSRKQRRRTVSQGDLASVAG
jgi:hypothetical protein